MKYRCNKHKSNDGFYDLKGKWFCWYCYEESNTIKVGDYITLLISFVISGRDLKGGIFRVNRVFPNGGVRIRYNDISYDFSSSVIERSTNSRLELNL